MQFFDPTYVIFMFPWKTKMCKIILIKYICNPVDASHCQNDALTILIHALFH